MFTSTCCLYLQFSLQFINIINDYRHLRVYPEKIYNWLAYLKIDTYRLAGRLLDLS